MRLQIIDKAILEVLPQKVAAVIVVAVFACASVASQVPSLPADLNVERMFSRAQAGYVQDQIALAQAYKLGKGVRRDAVEAAQWFLKAANFGSPRAQTEIGYLYMTGEGVSQDALKAFQWFQRAAA